MVDFAVAAATGHCSSTTVCDVSLWHSIDYLTPSRETLVNPQRYQKASDVRDYTANSSCLTLSSEVTLDYSTEIGGFPVFDVHPTSGPVQVESKYSESRVALDAPFADGPWTFSNELANTFRVETFNVTKSGHVESFFIQGGLRWQRLKLLTPQSTIKVCRVGIRSANDRTAVDALPGHFECSNPLYNEIWALGPRTVQQACIANHTAPSTWEVTSDGVFLRGQQPAQSVKGASFANYTMTFRSKIVRGGTGWKAASGVDGYGPYFVLTSEYPSGFFLNTNRTIVPPNTLVVGYGYNLVNQTSLTTGAIKHFPLSFDIKEGGWYDISTTINQTGYSISINDHPAVFVALKHLQTPSASLGGSGSLTGGTWGFGPYQDQLAYVKDVKVLARNGTHLYQNPMTSASVLEEYGVMPNGQPVCLDGAKRDRLVWSGDFTHTYRVVSASTYRQDFLIGTLTFILNRQATSGPYAGFFSMQPTMGQSTKYTLVYNSFGILDYQMLFLNAFAGYYLDFADDAFLKQYWPQTKKGVEAVLPLVDSASGLVSQNQALPGSFFVGPANGTAPSALLVYTLQRMAKLAHALGKTQTATYWTRTATQITNAINRQLWNDKTGTYGESLSSLNSSSITGTAFTILSDVANHTQARKSIAALSTLRLGIGYKESTSTSSHPTTNLSPNLSGFLLEALLAHSRSSTTPSNTTTSAISTLFNQLWPAMITQDDYYTGTAWEYLYPNGKPGLDLYTSHAHPWSTAPTYVFTEYVLGIQSTAPGFREWAFRPAVLDVGVEWARGRVPTPYGAIRASWGFGADRGRLDMKVCAPGGTKGVVGLPVHVVSYTVDGQERGSSGGLRVDIEDGKCSKISLVLK